jgi:hypothetical protein
VGSALALWPAGRSHLRLEDPSIIKGELAKHSYWSFGSLRLPGVRDVSLVHGSTAARVWPRGPQASTCKPRPCLCRSPSVVGRSHPLFPLLPPCPSTQPFSPTNSSHEPPSPLVSQPHAFLSAWRARRELNRIDCARAKWAVLTSAATKCCRPWFKAYFEDDHERVPQECQRTPTTLGRSLRPALDALAARARGARPRHRHTAPHDHVASRHTEGGQTRQISPHT